MVVDDVSEDKENLGEGASIRAGEAVGGAAILLLSCLSLVRRCNLVKMVMVEV